MITALFDIMFGINIAKRVSRLLKYLKAKPADFSPDPII